MDKFDDVARVMLPNYRAYLSRIGNSLTVAENFVRSQNDSGASVQTMERVALSLFNQARTEDKQSAVTTDESGALRFKVPNVDNEGRTVQTLGEMLGESMSAKDVRTVGNDTSYVPGQGFDYAEHDKKTRAAKQAQEFDYWKAHEAARTLSARGGFAGCLSDAFFRADKRNAERLARAFPELFGDA